MEVPGCPRLADHIELCALIYFDPIFELPVRKKKVFMHANRQASSFHLTHPGQHNTFCSLTLLTLVVGVGVEGSTSTPVQCVRRPVFKAWIVYWNPVVTAVQAHAAKKRKKKKNPEALACVCCLANFPWIFYMHKLILFAHMHGYVSARASAAWLYVFPAGRLVSCFLCRHCLCRCFSGK